MMCGTEQSAGIIVSRGVCSRYYNIKIKNIGYQEDICFQEKADIFFARYARRATAVPARAGIRRATVIERQCREMTEVSR